MFRLKLLHFSFVPLILVFCFPALHYAQVPPEPREWGKLPPVCVSAHDVGKVILGISNKGYFGNSTLSKYYPCVDGRIYPSACEYPKGSDIKGFGEGSIWIGGVLGSDTLVTEGFFGVHWESEAHKHSPPSEFSPPDFPPGNIVELSNKKSSEHFDVNAVSEQDLIAVFTDTIVTAEYIYDNHSWRDFLDYRLHQPLWVEVIQRTYVWSIGYAEDIIFFDLTVTNIGGHTIEAFSLGVHIESYATHIANLSGASDDFVGFISDHLTIDGCLFKDTLNLMWTADNDGDPIDGEFTEQLKVDEYGQITKSARDVMGTMFISAPELDDIWFNWWDYYYNVGPMRIGNYRNYQTGGTGSPEGDRSKYFIMGNGEIDYPPFYIKRITPFNLTWMYPDQESLDYIVSGGHPDCLISFRDGQLNAGSSVNIVFAIVAGENLHTDPNNLQNLPDNPDQYYANLDFSDLARNAQVAKWIYDNPGIDTDGDGYFGEYRVCVLDSMFDADSNWNATVAETTWYKGDGVPDWKVALPPPAPKMWVTPMFNGIHVRFNGSASESSKDIFTQLNDFEGYRIYISRDDREHSYSRLASYDIENYDKYIWNEQKQPDPGWELLDFPMSKAELLCHYAASCDDSLFDPLSFRSSRPYQLANFPESLFYWEKHESNVNEFGVTTEIKKIYPTARDPRLVPADSLTTDDFTDDGYYKYFEYEYTIENILPTVGYYVSVTAFDFGWPKSHLEPLESSITDNAKQVFASVIDSAFNGNNKQVVVYPNPYRNDENYRSRGFEGLGNEDRSNERVRRIHFANLPPKCIISIFSLDGDLVREIHHDRDPSDPASAHEEWGLISRNGLAVVSGLYYWTVEFESGEVQMGKLAIIL